PIIGAVGELQFEVLIHRLQDEYNLEVKLNRLPYGVARWPTRDGKPAPDLKGGANMCVDLNDNPVVLVNQEWDLNWLKRENPDVEFQTSISRAR
ncbi:MAG: peptide chain release factor 3, partial [Bdellovibrio sp.]|nr:peptide chain release factor 3 [Bdellovibrio sp.]